MLLKQDHKVQINRLSQKILIGFSLGLTSLALAFSGTTHPEWIGRTFPDVSSVAQQNRIDIGSLTGKAIFTFALPTCGNCNLQISNLGAVLEKNPDTKAFVVTSEDSENTRALIRGLPNIKLLVDAQGSLVKALGLRKVPATVFVDSKNTVQGFYEGVLDRAETLELGQALAAGTMLRKIVVPGDTGSVAFKIPGINWKTAAFHLLAFHGLDCSACAAAISEVLGFVKKNSKTSVWIVTRDNANAVQKQYGKPLPNLKVVSLKDNKVFSGYAVTGTPTHILVGQDGVIRWRSVGYAAGVLDGVPVGSSSR
jgi:hypothetical protein